MKRLLPYPLLSLCLALVWLVLNEPLDTMDLLLAVPVALAGGAILRRVHAPSGRVAYRMGVMAALIGLTFLDIVESNLAVLRIVLFPPARARVAGFLAIPLELRNPSGLAVLAAIVTATPGTSWARYDAEDGVLTIHVLDLRDEAGWIRNFKARYERRLMEIFR
jgi:multicomponent K+:H+ antiporter subunit E